MSKALCLHNIHLSIECSKCNKDNRLVKLKADNEKLKKCVEFYSDIDKCQVLGDDYKVSDKHSGKLARQTLKDIEVTNVK